MIAAVFEVGWPTGLKMAETSAFKVGWIVFALAAMAFSGVFFVSGAKGDSDRDGLCRLDGDWCKLYFFNRRVVFS